MIEGLLFGIRPFESTIVSAAGALVAAALAGLIPAWRASRVDPVGALRMPSFRWYCRVQLHTLLKEDGAASRCGTPLSWTAKARQNRTSLV